MDDKKVVKNYLLKILDFAYAIKVDADAPRSGGIAATMADEIRCYGEKALEELNRSV